MRTTLAAVLAGFLILLPVAGSAWKGELAAGVRSIAEVHEKAESGDIVTVEGQVIDVRNGNGSLRIVELEDDTGTVLIAVPEYLRREFGENPSEGRRARVRGKWDHKYMKPGVWGIRAQGAERIED